MTRLLFSLGFVGMMLLPPSPVHAVSKGAQPASASEHIAWVAESLKRMQTVKAGMTRRDLLVVFTSEAGLSTGVRETFVSRDCPYFKVDVQFDAVGRPRRDGNGRITLEKSEHDIIKTISRSYLQQPIRD